MELILYYIYVFERERERERGLKIHTNSIAWVFEREREFMCALCNTYTIYIHSSN